MSDPFDPFDLLGGLNPQNPADLRAMPHSPHGRDTLEQIVRTTPRRTRFALVAKPLRLRTAVVVACVPLAAGIVAVAIVLARGTGRNLTVHCYTRADLAAPAVRTSTRLESPIDACRQAWRSHPIGTFPSSAALEACLLRSGSVAVFPSPRGRVCRMLRLQPYAASTER
jgi:hypothetical protein